MLPTVPKIAPDAPTDGNPTRAKLPPRTLPKMPAAKYMTTNPKEPTSFSTYTIERVRVGRTDRIATAYLRTNSALHEHVH